MRLRVGGRLLALSLVATTAFAAGLAPRGDDGLRLADHDYAPDPVSTVGQATDMLVDQAHGHVFVAQYDADLLVLDLDGHPITTIPMPGPQGSMNLSERADALYLVASDTEDPEATTGNAIYRVDTRTLAVSTVATSDAGCPFGPIQELAGRVWYAANWCLSTTSTGDFGYVDLADGAVHPVRSPAPDIDAIFAFPGRSNRLVLLANVDVKLLSVDVGRQVTVSVLATRQYAYNGVAGVAPDGSEIVVSSYTGAIRYSAAGLVVLGDYQGTAEPTSIDVRGDGAVAIASGDGWSIYRRGQRHPTRTYRPRSTVATGASSDRSAAWYVYKRLAWGADRLYGVSGHDLFAFEPRLRPRLRVEIPAGDFHYGEDVSVAVTLVGPSEDRTVTVWAVDNSDTRELVGEYDVPMGDPLTIGAVAQRSGHLEVAYAGSDDYDPTYVDTSDFRVAAQVRSRIRSGRLVKGVHVHPVGEAVVLRSTVAPNHVGDCLVLELQVKSDGLWQEVSSSCATLNPDSLATARFEGSRKLAGRTFRVRGAFAGDIVNAASAGHWLSFRFVR